MTKIKNAKQAIEVIAEEVRKMFDKDTENTTPKQAEQTKYCIECGAETWYPKTHFCKLCAESFYKMEEDEE